LPVNCAPGYKKVAKQPLYIIERQEYANFFAGGEINAPLVVIFQRDFGFPKAYEFSDITCGIDLGDYESISVADLFIALFPLSGLVAYLIGAKEIIKQKMENNAERMAQHKACGCQLIPVPPPPPPPPDPTPNPIFPPDPPDCEYYDPSRKTIIAFFSNPNPPFQVWRVQGAFAWVVISISQTNDVGCNTGGTSAHFNNGDGLGWQNAQSLPNVPGFGGLTLFASDECNPPEFGATYAHYANISFEYDGQPVAAPNPGEAIWLEAPCTEPPIDPDPDDPDPIEPIDPDTFDFCLEFPELCNPCPPGTGNGRVVTLSGDFFETCTTTGNQQYTIEIVGE